jgi:hypothetical protein
MKYTEEINLILKYYVMMSKNQHGRLTADLSDGRPEKIEKG